MEMNWDGDLVQPLMQGPVVVVCAAFSPDGRWLAVREGSSTAVHLWSLNGKPRPRNLDFPPSVGIPSGGFTTLAFSLDGHTLAAGGRGTVCLWDSASGTRGQVLEGFEGQLVSNMAFSPDGRTLAVADDRCVQLWDRDTGTLRLSLSGHTHSIRGLAFSPDGQTVVAGYTVGNIDLWDPNTGVLQDTLGSEDHVFLPETLVFNPNGTLLAAGSATSGHGTVRLWDRRSGNLQQTLTAGAVQRGQSLTFSPDGRVLASVGADKAVRLWDVKSGHLRHTLATGDVQVACVVFSSDGHTLISCDDGLTMRWHRMGTG